jgi:energy-coupling factor transporter ATP-binding protein EcfA2
MPRHLDELIVHRFRGLRDVSLSDLGGINLLVGGNDSGKSSLLEALSIFVQPLRIKAWLDAGRLRHIGPTPLPVLLDWLSPHSAEQLSGNGSVAHASISGSGPSFEVRRSEARIEKLSRLRSPTSQAEAVYEQGVEVALSVFLSRGDTESVSFSVWGSDSLFIFGEPSVRGLNVQTITPVSHRVEQLQVQQLSEATIEGYKDKVLNLLRKVDSKIRAIEILSPQLEPAIYLEHTQVGTAPVAVFGDGIRRALSLALTLPRAANGILLIDEIEAAIHVSALGPLFKWLVEGCAEFNVQLFATTHSLEAVDAILESSGNESDLAAFRLRQEATGITCQRLSGDLLHRLRYERGLDVRV